MSPAAVIQVAASAIDSGGCCSAQVTAAVNNTASACGRAATLAAAASRSTSAGESSSPRSVPVIDVMTQSKQGPLTETGGNSLLWKGILHESGVRPRWFRPLFGIRSLVSSVRSLRSLLDHLGLRPLSAYVPGLVCPLASLAARPPWLGSPLGVRPWSRLIARFARCSTTPGCGRPSACGLRLVCPLASLAARPPHRRPKCNGPSAAVVDVGLGGVDLSWLRRMQNSLPSGSARTSQPVPSTFRRSSSWRAPSSRSVASRRRGGRRWVRGRGGSGS